MCRPFLALLLLVLLPMLISAAPAAAPRGSHPRQYAPEPVANDSPVPPGPGPRQIAAPVTA